MCEVGRGEARVGSAVGSVFPDWKKSFIARQTGNNPHSFYLKRAREYLFVVFVRRIVFCCDYFQSEPIDDDQRGVDHWQSQ